MGRKSKLKLFILFTPIIIGVFVNTRAAFAYGVEAHAYLTEEIIDFYNKHYQEKRIPENLRPFLVDGSRREDDAPRWMNHFYDPINDRGLDSAAYGSGYASTEWAVSSEKQTEVRYKAYAFIGSILTAIQEKSLGELTTESDFTWDRALEFYVRGDKEKAMFVLGHIIHLLEDASVPDHTRNDPHPGHEWNESPYEGYAEKFSPNNPDKELKSQLVGKNPILQDSVENYFNAQAKYSNNNFYSKDTIGASGTYQLPVPDYEEVFGGYLYGMKKNNDSDYRLFVRKSVSLVGGIAVSNASNISLILNNEEGGDAVLIDYWRLLSVSSVQHSAGLLNLFFEEADRAKNEGKFQDEDSPSFFGNFWNGTKKLWNKLFGNDPTSRGSASLVDVIPLDSTSQTSEDRGQGINSSISSEQAFGPSGAGENQGSPSTGQGTNLLDGDATAVNTEEPAESVNSVISVNQRQNKNQDQFGGFVSSTSLRSRNDDPGSSSSPAQNNTESAVACSYNKGGTPSHEAITINEVAWMGTVNSANDEWIELKNIASETKDISGWHLFDKDEQINITFKSGSAVSPGEFYLLERTDDSTLPNIKADVIYSGALANSSEGLRLYNSKCELIDEVIALSSWPAGNNSTKHTMERLSGFGWKTSTNVGGTPRADNSAPPPSGGGGSSNGSPAPSPSPAPDPEPESLPPPPQEPLTVNHVLISEIQAGTEANGTEDEFVELYNPTDSKIDLTGWSLKKKTSSGNASNLVSSSAFVGKIAPKSFFLIAHQNYKGNVAADLIYSANSQNLAYTSNSVVLYDGGGAIVDEVNYIEIHKSESIERKAYTSDGCVSPQDENEFSGNGCDADSSSDFVERSLPKPQNTASLPEPRSAPAAMEDLNITFSASDLALNFNWESAGNDDYTYEVKEYNSPGVLIYTGTSTSFVKRVSEVGRSYEFSIEAIDRDGLRSNILRKNFEVEGILSGLYFYASPTSSIYAGTSILELAYDSYPIVYDLTSLDGGSNWRVLAFYYNTDAPSHEFLEGANPRAEDGPQTLYLEWDSCAGSTGFKPSLLLPDDESACGTGGGFINNALSFPRYIEENFNHLYFKVRTQDGSNAFDLDDFLTVAYYGFYRTYPQGTRIEDGALNNFKLLAVDKTHYYFNQVLPEHRAPELSGELQFDYLSDGHLNLEWQEAEDADTKRDLLTYEVSFSTSTGFLEEDWRSLGRKTSVGREVYPGESFLIGVRARDELGNYSNILSMEWEHPSVEFFIEQLHKNGLSIGWGDIPSNCRECNDGLIDRASLQSFAPDDDFDFNKVILDIVRGYGDDSAGFLLAVYEDDGESRPDFSNKLGETQSEGNIFYFDLAVSVSGGTTYWFVLDARYGDPRGYSRNQFRNVISTTSSFEGGKAGYGPSSECSDGNYCYFVIPFPSSESDWYMSVGYEG